jgi:hypothetical protein
LRELPAFLMSRICERGARNFGRESKRAELYAAGVVGVLLLILVISAALILDALVPDLVELKSATFSKLGLASIWIFTTAVAYMFLVPEGRYRKWSEDFRRRHELARDRPGFTEVLAIALVFAVLVVSIGFQWLRSVLAN